MSFLQPQVWQLWAVAAVLLLVGEVLTPGFVLACFAIACVPPAIMTLFGSFGWQTQMAVFAASSLAVFFFLRPVILRYFSSRESRVPSNAEALIGQVGVVVKTIPAGGTEGGYVRVAGKEWWAFEPEGREIPEGTRVEVLRVRGASIEVKVRGEAASQDGQRED